MTPLRKSFVAKEHHSFTSMFTFSVVVDLPTDCIFSFFPPKLTFGFQFFPSQQKLSSWTSSWFLSSLIADMYFVCKNTRDDSKVCCSLIRQKKKRFFAQSEARTATTVWNWPGKTFFTGTLFPVLYFTSRHFSRPFRLSLAPTIYPWVSEDVSSGACLDMFSFKALL